MNEKQAITAFSALSQETRLRIVKILVTAGPEGLAAGAIADAVGVSPSNVSFHLKELENAHLIASHREARSIVYAASFEAIGDLLRYMMEDCCSGRPEICMPILTTVTCCPPTPKEVQTCK